MTMDAATLQRLSSLLDHAFDLDAAQRDAWLDALAKEDAALASTLRALLARTATVVTAQLLDRPPAFTVAGTAGDDGNVGEGGSVGAYRLIRRIGHGGMGEVWLAERDDAAMKRTVALKMPHVSWSPALAERFRRERDILAALEHPGIARLYDAGVDRRGRPFMALEYVEGKPIDAFCRERALPVRARLELLLQAARAVAFAHSRLVLHRDLKPSNLLVTDQGELRLLDFGIAKLMDGDAAYETALTQVLGRALTLDYASPEQIRGEPLATASDVYSLGVVAFEILAGARPYRLKRRSAAELEDAITREDAPLASTVAVDAGTRKQLHGDLDAILQQALRKDPAARYASVGLFAQDIERYLRGEPVLARPDRATYRLRKFVARNRAAVSASLAVIVAIVAGAGVAVWQASVARAQSEEARAQAALAKNEAQRAQAVQGFMIDLFRTNSHQQADPLKAQQTTARDLLDIGAARVSEALKDAPESEMIVLNTLSDMYVQLDLRPKAIALQRRSVDVARRTRARDDPVLADAILSFVATLQDRPERTQIPPLLDEAKAALDAAGENTTFLRAALLVETARYNKYESIATARDTADEAVAFFERYHPQRASLVTCYRLAAQARLRARDFEGAEAQAQLAVDTARLRGPAAPAWVAGSLTDLAEAQQGQLKLAAAEASLREALAHSLQVNGERHRETLLTQLKLANVLLVTGRTDEGAAMQDKVRATIAAAPPGRYERMLLEDVDYYLAATALARGRPQDAVDPLVRDIASTRAAFMGSNALSASELELADVLIAMKRLPDARTTLDEATAHRRAALGGADALRAWLPYLRVQAALQTAEGNPANALETLAVVPPEAIAWADAEPAAIEIERAHALRALGRATEATQAARLAVSALQARTASTPMPQREAGALEALGAAEIAAGRRDEARAAYSRALALRRAHDAEGSRWREGDERMLAALQAGDRSPIAAR